MGALQPPVSSHWIPEDDLILKNAVEGGASLESLARGAVQFSHKFSVRELKERWHSLLYDPVISAEAASRMMEFEQATASSSKSKDSKCSISIKRRRSESVRNCYYAMRKRVRNDAVDVSSFLVTTGSGHYLDNNGDEPLPEQCLFINPESSQFELQESSLGITSHACPEGYFSELSNFLLDFPPDEMLLMEADHGKDSIDNSYDDGLSSLLLNSPSIDNSYDDGPSSLLLNSPKDDHSKTEPSLFPAKDKENGSHQCGDVHSSEVQVLPSISFTLDPEMTDGVICCMLNTEDPMIPCNDRVVFTNHLVPKSSGRASIRDAGKPNNKECLTSAQRHLGNPVQYEVQVLADIGLLHRSGTNFELVGGDTTRSKSGGIAYGCSASNYSGNAGARLNEKSIVVAANKRHLNYNSAGSLFDDPTSDLEEAEEVESEDDVPSFSDIEAMILDTDLDPKDHAIHANELVLKYQHEDTKKAIMKLDQAAYACRQRSIESRKAFAVLRGHNSKHYIRKPEVLLGRQTEGVIVDIDLGMEGRGAHKISRRQAMIKLDSTGGSFQLRNLGRFPISVNDTEVACGESTDLTSCCFIEIRGMSFVFEANKTFVKQYLDNMAQTNEIREHIAC